MSGLDWIVAAGLGALVVVVIAADRYLDDRERWDRRLRDAKRRRELMREIKRQP